jgi:hypothetical protein
MNQFIGLGFQKCATTWLSIRLRRHPRLYVPAINELRFWNHFEIASDLLPPQRDYMARWEKALAKGGKKQEIFAIRDKITFWNKYVSTRPDGADAYAELFSDHRGATCCGEISPSYVGLTEETLLLIEKAFSPKVFVIMREPIARIWSQIRHEARLRPGNVSTVEKMVSQIETEKYRIQADYSGIIAKLGKVFPQERIGLFFFEDMLADEEIFLTSVCQFIGVPFEKKLLIQRKASPKKDPSYGMPDAVAKRAIELYGDQAEEIERLTGRIPSNWIKHS